MKSFLISLLVLIASVSNLAADLDSTQNARLSNIEKQLDSLDKLQQIQAVKNEIEKQYLETSQEQFGCTLSFFNIVMAAMALLGLLAAFFLYKNKKDMESEIQNELEEKKKQIEDEKTEVFKEICLKKEEMETEIGKTKKLAVELQKEIEDGKKSMRDIHKSLLDEKRDDLMAKSFTSLDTVTKNIKENISPIPAIKQFEKIEPLKLSSNILENFIKYSNLESENERSLSPEEYFYKGVALSESGNYNEAISMYKKAIEKDPKFFRAMNNLGTVYNKLGNYLDAERELMRALEIKPNDDIILNNLGDVYSNQGKYEEAIKYFMQAIDKNKKQPKYYYNLGNIYNAIDEYDKAIEIYEKALNFDNNQAEVLNNLGISYYEKEEFLTSEKYFRQSIEADPNYLNAYHNLALIHHKNNELQQALDCYNEIIKRNPKTNLNAFYNRSCTYALLNNKSLMIEDLKKAIDINPKAKIEARTDEDFQKYRDDPDFIELTSQ